jgi:hypothetical protein
MAMQTRADVKRPKQFKKLRKKGMKKSVAARIANSKRRRKKGRGRKKR